MEVNFSKLRVSLMLVFMLIFLVLGGYLPPVVSEESLLSQRRVTKAWLLCVVLFNAGGFCVSFVDHYVGTIDRSNMRPAYI